MGKRPKNYRRPALDNAAKSGGPKRRRRSTGVDVTRSLDGKSWLLAHPRCIQERADDLDEVRAIIAAGELDVAIDELRWLVDGCSELIEGHFLLGKLAVEVDADLPLARGHFGIGYQFGDRALRRAGNPKPAPALHPANRPFFDCGRGLAWCLHELGKGDMAIEVIARLLELDASDPLGVGPWIDEIRTSGAQIITLDQMFQK
jgi:hypothetical protein